MRQLVYLDESGDAGLKLGAGSTPTLVVGAVVFQTAQDAEATAACINAYRRDVLRKGARFQFHFSHLCAAWRMGLLEAVRDCPFEARAVVIKKARAEDRAGGAAAPTCITWPSGRS